MSITIITSNFLKLPGERQRASGHERPAGIAHDGAVDRLLELDLEVRLSGRGLAQQPLARRWLRRRRGGGREIGSLIDGRAASAGVRDRCIRRPGVGPPGHVGPEAREHPPAATLQRRGERLHDGADGRHGHVEGSVLGPGRLQDSDHLLAAVIEHGRAAPATQVGGGVQGHLDLVVRGRHHVTEERILIRRDLGGNAEDLDPPARGRQRRIRLQHPNALRREIQREDEEVVAHRAPWSAEGFARRGQQAARHRHALLRATEPELHLLGPGEVDGVERVSGRHGRYARGPILRGDEEGGSGRLLVAVGDQHRAGHGRGLCRGARRREQKARAPQQREREASLPAHLQNVSNAPRSVTKRGILKPAGLPPIRFTSLSLRNAGRNAPRRRVRGIEDGLERCALIIHPHPASADALVAALSAAGLRVEVATDGARALALAEACAPSLVVAAEDLPETEADGIGPAGGIAALRRFRERFPDAARVLWSGRRDFALACEAVNQAAIAHLVAEPWQPADIAALRRLALGPVREALPKTLGALVPAVEGSADAADMVSRLGGILARQAPLRELWWVDPASGLLQARAAGILPLEDRPLRTLDDGTAALVRAACEARAVQVLEGETAVGGARAAGNAEAAKVALLALPLRRDGRLLGAVGLVSTSAAAFPPALVAALRDVAEPMADAVAAAQSRAAQEGDSAPLARWGSLTESAALAAAVAHEIGNPLAAMTRALGGLRANPALGPEDEALIEMLMEEFERLRRIARDSLALAGPCARRFATTDVVTLIEQVASLLRRDPRFEAGVLLDTELPAELPEAALDPDKIRQVLWNLCLNAAQALPLGGRIRVRAFSLRDRDTDGVGIEVLDDGPGIAPELRERVFAPFETARLGGTGLGLALASHAIALHQGWIRIVDAPGGGACVRLWLPLAGPAGTFGAGAGAGS